MASLRNAIKRHTHKERSQPAHRNRLGLLEKHKDYVLRAKDYHKKEKALQILKEKAAFRNPDEFNFKMINSRMVDGHHRKINGGKQYTQEELYLMKTQDTRYVQHQAQAEQRSIANFLSEVKERLVWRVDVLRGTLHGVGDTRPNSHIYFAEDKNEEEELKSQIVQREAQRQPYFLLTKRQKSAYRELGERSDRAKRLKDMAMDMNMKSKIMKKGKKQRIVGEDGQVCYKWRQERQR